MQGRGFTGASCQFAFIIILIYFVEKNKNLVYTDNNNATQQF